MRVARIARPGAIYDASAAARTFPECGTIAENGEIVEISEIGEADLTRDRASDFGHMPGFTKFL